MSSRLRFAARAQAEILEARRWWLESRPAASDAFDEDLDRALGTIESMPDVGQLVENALHPGTRKLLIGRVRDHVYYRAHDDIVEVLACWHASRGQGPGV